MGNGPHARFVEIMLKCKSDAEARVTFLSLSSDTNVAPRPLGHPSEVLTANLH